MDPSCPHCWIIMVVVALPIIGPAIAWARCKLRRKECSCSDHRECCSQEPHAHSDSSSAVSAH
jgi:hypothetical protein